MFPFNRKVFQVTQLYSLPVKQIIIKNLLFEILNAFISFYMKFGRQYIKAKLSSDLVARKKSFEVKRI